jgi:DNA-binding NarL/FixJ family response regulator
MSASMPRTNARTRILIVDDHPIVRRGLAELIEHEEDLEVCAEAADAAEAMHRVAATHPHVVVVDISLPGDNGIELIKKIRAYDDGIRMLVSSMHDESLYAERVLRAGAKGYINKSEATENIIDAIRLILSGRVYLSQRMTDRVLQQVGGGEDPEHSPVDELSDRELEVFELIGRGLATRQIAEQLHLSTKTIDTYRTNIKTKLNLSTGTEMTQRAVQWVLEGR